MKQYSNLLFAVPAALKDAALHGKKGGLLWSISAKDGSSKSELKLESTPVWDGMACAEAKLFLATVDGKVTCYIGE